MFNPEIPKEVQRKIHRGQYGKWVFCLAELNRKLWPGKLKLVEMTSYTNEASAIAHFKAYLEAGGYFLIKAPKEKAIIMFHETREDHELS